MELCIQLRAFAAQTPIVVLTEGDDIHRILLLESGADDCMVKPFSMRELLARIRAILRRESDHPREPFALRMCKSTRYGA